MADTGDSSSLGKGEWHNLTVIHVVVSALSFAVSYSPSRTGLFALQERTNVRRTAGKVFGFVDLTQCRGVHLVDLLGVDWRHSISNWCLLL